VRSTLRAVDGVSSGTIGTAILDNDGRIVLYLRAEDPEGGILGDAVLVLTPQEAAAQGWRFDAPPRRGVAVSVLAVEQGAE
jgi:hypothetical protein